jgi:4-hydroxybenzoate polyprenyltransferase
LNKSASAFKNFLTISRANIQIASLPTALLGVVYSAQGWQEVFNLSVLVYVLLFFVLLTYACSINCVSDVEVDSHFKRNLSDAVCSLGPSSLKLILFLEIFVSLALIGLLCLLKQDIIYSVAVMGLVCGYMYSAPPARIKKRGWFSPFPVMLGLYFMPILAGGYVASGMITIKVIILSGGYALLMQGITFINTCEDYSEDQRTGIKTLAHELGVKRILETGAVCVAMGGICLIALILFIRLRLHLERDLLSLLFLVGLFYFVYVLFCITRRLYLLSGLPDPESGCKRYGKRMRWWFVSTRYPLLVIGLLLLAET